MKNILKTLVKSLPLMIIGGFLFINKVVAYTVGFDTDESLQGATGLGSNDPASITYGIINTVLIFMGVITLVLIIYAGFIWMLAAGNDEQVGKAKKILKGAIIGLVIVLASYGISQYIFNTLVATTT